MSIDLNGYPIGTLFQYKPATTHCRDGQAELREWSNGERFLHDTYWVGAGSESILSAAEVKTASFYFDPSRHRQVKRWDIAIFPEGTVITIYRQSASYETFYVPIDQPDLTLVDRVRHSTAVAEQEYRTAIANVDVRRQHVEHMRRELARVEAEAGAMP